MMQRMPIIVLANSDSRGGHVPDGLRRDLMLEGPKGLLELPNGKCLAQELVSRLRESDRFDGIYLAGPQRLYSGRVDCEIVDVEGHLGQTLSRIETFISERLDPQAAVAFSACDILPSSQEFRRLIDDHYSPHAGSVFWWQLIGTPPEQMNASSWKPAYHLSPCAGGTPANLYPGHVVIVRPQSLRWKLTSRILHLAYHYRNRPLTSRYPGFVLRVLGSLFAQDIRNLLALQFPVLTFGIPVDGLVKLIKHQTGRMTVADCESFLRRALVHREFRHVANERPVAVSVVPIVSFARDIDTVTEFEEVTKGLACDSD